MTTVIWGSRGSASNEEKKNAGRPFSDIAIAPPEANEFEALELYHATSGGEAALARKRRDDIIRTKSLEDAAP